MKGLWYSISLLALLITWRWALRHLIWPAQHSLNCHNMEGFKDREISLLLAWALKLSSHNHFFELRHSKTTTQICYLKKFGLSIFSQIRSRYFSIRKQMKVQNCVVPNGHSYSL